MGPVVSGSDVLCFVSILPDPEKYTDQFQGIRIATFRSSLGWAGQLFSPATRSAFYVSPSQYGCIRPIRRFFRRTTFAHVRRFGGAIGTMARLLPDSLLHSGRHFASGYIDDLAVVVCSEWSFELLVGMVRSKSAGLVGR